MTLRRLCLPAATIVIAIPIAAVATRPSLGEATTAAVLRPIDGSGSAADRPVAGWRGPQEGTDSRLRGSASALAVAEHRALGSLSAWTTPSFAVNEIVGFTPGHTGVSQSYPTATSALPRTVVRRLSVHPETPVSVPTWVEPFPCDARWVDVPLPDGTPFAASIERAAHQAGVHPRLLAAVVQAESRFDPTAVSSAGACGLTQLMPAAAIEHGVADVFDPDENLRGGAAHLRSHLDRFSSLVLALAAYNAGAATVRRAEGVPPYDETQRFVREVMGVFCPDHSVPSASPLL